MTMGPRGEDNRPLSDGSLTVTIRRGEEGPDRTLRISSYGLRWGGLIAGLFVGGCVLMIATWGRLALQASRVAELEGEISTLREEEQRIEALALSLAEVEEAYERIRSLFGADLMPVAEDLWLPAATGGASRGALSGEPDLPSAWPLTQAGYITQDLLPGVGVEHPGIDIAIPVGSYVRAAGGGTVLEVGDDEIYGNFVVLDHPTGYRTRYAHASMLLVTEGLPVRRNEVIALSGSTGRSTAPHLHFEILQDGSPVDPLLLVEQP